MFAIPTFQTTGNDNWVPGYLVPVTAHIQMREDGLHGDVRQKIKVEHDYVGSFACFFIDVGCSLYVDFVISK